MAKPRDMRELTGADAARMQQRRRSIAIAMALGVLVLLFYAVTMVKVGGHIINRTM